MNKENVVYRSLLFSLTLIIYLVCIPKHYFIGDSAELITNIITMGVAHPPGYPLYLLIGKGFTELLFFMEPTVALNMLSAIFSAFVSIVLFEILLLKGVNHIIAFLSTFVLIFTDIVWSQSVIAEVYTLNLLILALQIYYLLKWRIKKQNRHLYLLFIFMGLGLTHHISIGIYYILYLAFIIVANSSIVKNLKQIIFLIILMVLPLLLYIYIPISSNTNPPIDWGNPENIKGLIDHVTVRQFSHQFLLYKLEGFIHQFKLFISLFTKEYHVFILLIIAGITYLYNEKQFRVLFLLTGIGIMNVIFSCSYFIKDIEVYFIPFYFVANLFIGFGLQNLFLHIKMQKGIRYIITIIIIMGFVIFLFTRNFSRNDRSNYFLAYDYGKEAIRIIEESSTKPSIFYAEGDYMDFTMAYFRSVERIGKSIIVKDKNLLHLDKENIEPEPKIHDIYYTKPGESQYEGYKVIPYGLVYRLVRRDSKQIFDKFDEIKIRNITDDTFTFIDKMTANLVGDYHYQKGRYYISKGEKELALEEFNRAGEINQENQNMQFNLGLIYDEIGLYERAYKSYERVIALADFTKISELARNKSQFSKYMLEEYDPSDEVQKYINLGVTYYKNGIILNNLGLINKGINCLEKALTIKPDSFIAHFNLAGIYASLPSVTDEITYYNNAIEHYLIAQKINPNNKSVNVNIFRLKNFITQFKQASHYMNISNYSKALFHYKKAVIFIPDDKITRNNIRILEKRLSN